jgi:hypothetical protein
MKKELIIRGLAVASAAVIIGGVIIAKSNPFGLADPADNTQEDRQKIESR